ncbi:MAG: hypothetical protein HDR95_04610 [Bacteroides sp.]|nr:hypothetical protein [Bacteroides sp.]
MRTRTKTYRERIQDPETGEISWEFREVKRISLEEEDRMQLVAQILRGERTAEDIRRSYGIVSINSVYSWIGKYVSQEKSLSLEGQTEEDMAKKSKDDQIRELKAQLKQARKEAELEKLRAHAYDTMINLAEETFNIPIRKKSGTKQ